MLQVQQGYLKVDGIPCQHPQLLHLQLKVFSMRLYHYFVQDLNVLLEPQIELPVDFRQQYAYELHVLDYLALLVPEVILRSFLHLDH
ncbi:hypothetical protein D3C76_1547760 [compost metagenome]